MTGFRGIGIWAGFQACDRLEITTTKAGDSQRYQLQIDFKEIFEHVEDNINIKTLLDERFRIQHDDAKEEEHYTRVKLIGIPAESRMLTKRQELKRIVSQILPCRVDPKFKFSEKLNKFYNSIEDFQEYPIEVEGTEVFKHFPECVNDFSEVNLSQDGEDYGKNMVGEWK